MPQRSLPRSRAKGSSALACTWRQWLRVSRLLPILCLVSVLAAGVGRAEPLELRAEVEGIREYRLENGLKLLLFPDPSVASVTVNITYLVGSRHEGRGEAGMAHLLEHMVFKGTPTTPDVWDALEDRGARFNGTTWVDRTNYYETLPASNENLEFALELEADRMINSSIRAEDLETEMTVVRNEFESGENNPLGVLRQRMLSAAYLWHPYGRSTIGNRSDIERVPVESLRGFYRKYYQPDNAMLVIAGRFDEKFALETVRRTFGAIPRPKRVLEDPYTVEPPQDGPRSVILSRVGSVASAGLLYHVPAGSHPDAAALDVLGELLDGEPSGRLYRSLVAKKLASGLYASVYSWHDPGVFIIQSEVATGQDPTLIQKRMISQVEQLAEEISDEEVERARNKLLKDYRLGLSDSRRIAISLSDAEAQGDWRLLFLQRDALAKVEKADVARVAAAYLTAANRTAGLFLPTESPTRAAIPEAPDIEPLLAGYEGSEGLAVGEAFEATAANIEKQTLREKLDGIELAMLPKSTRGRVVRAELRFNYGSESQLEKHTTAADLLPDLMERGTKKRDYSEIRAELDRLQAELDLSGEAGALQVSLQVPRDKLDATLDLLVEILREPSLPEDQLDILRNQRIARIERVRSDPQGVLFDELYRALEPYPKESIHYRPTFDEQVERLEKVSRSEIADLYARLLSAGHVEAALVGDFDPAAVRRSLRAKLASWKSEASYERIEREHLQVTAADRTFDTPDKEMTVVARGTSFSMQDTDPDYPAIRFANYVFGQSPSSRLLTELRQNRGLSYGAGSFVRASSEDPVAQLAAYAICAPQNAREAQDVIRAEFARWVEKPISEEELAGFRDGYLERFRNQLADDSTVARQLVENLRLDRPFTYYRELVDRAVALSGEEIQAALERQLGTAAYVDFKAGDVAKFGAKPEPVEGGD